MTTLCHSSPLPLGADRLLDQSQYALGSSVWNVVFLQANTGGNWTTAELDERRARIQSAASRWNNQPENLALHPAAQLDLQVNFVNSGIPLSVNAANVTSSFYDDALAQLHSKYAGLGPTPATQAFNADMRDQFATHWSFTTFVQHVNGPASSLLNGPYTNAYLDDPAWTYAHEVGHIFGAADEYDGAVTAVTNYRSGYLWVENENAERLPNGGYNIHSQPRLMRTVDNYQLSAGTVASVGWLDSDADTIPDILDTFPTVTLTSPIGGAASMHAVTFQANVTPLTSPNPTMGDSTINVLAAAQYRVNDNTWVNLPLGAGTPGAEAVSPYEQVFSLELTDLFSRQNVVDVRVANSVGNFGYLQFHLTGLPELPGDFNLDGIVDAVDYPVWRDALGQQGADLPADANWDMNVDIADYEIWRSAFGQSTGSASPVPEPTGALLLTLTTVGILSPFRMKP